MKVLIVDDEHHVRETIRMLADWESLGVDTVLEADNGLVACDFIENEHPHIVITDMMMPYRSGVELMDWIRQFHPEIQLIAISAHRDFDMVQMTLKHGGIDYLLKPIECEMLESAIQKAVLQHQRDRMSSSLLTQRSIIKGEHRYYRAKRLADTLLEPGNYLHAREELLHEFPFLSAVTSCRAAVLYIGLPDPDPQEALHQTEQFDPEAGGQAILLQNRLHPPEIILLAWGDSVPSDEAFRALVQKLESALPRRCFGIGIGGIASSPESIHRSYAEARKALKAVNVLDPAARMNIYREHETAQPLKLHFHNYEEMFKLALTSGGSARIEHAIDTWIAAVSALNVISLEQLILWCKEINLMNMLWLQQHEPARYAELSPDIESSSPAMAFDETGSFSPDAWRRSLSLSLGRYMQPDLGYRTSGSSLVSAIVRYINDNYQLNLNLQDLSDKFYMSRDYLSRIFKQQTGHNLVDYINQVRTDNAARLLVNKQLKIAEVAAMVGYNDEKYFSKMFKRFVGTSPSNYRRNYVN